MLPLKFSNALKLRKTNSVHFGTAWKSNKFMAEIVVWRQMIVVDHFAHVLRACSNFGCIDSDCRVFVAIDLTALDLLQPSVARNGCHAGSLGRIGIEHGEEDAA
jgi:hypothetical protein